MHLPLHMGLAERCTTGPLLDTVGGVISLDGA